MLLVLLLDDGGGLGVGVLRFADGGVVCGGVDGEGVVN